MNEEYGEFGTDGEWGAWLTRICNPTPLGAICFQVGILVYVEWPGSFAYVISEATHVASLCSPPKSVALTLPRHSADRRG